MYRSRVPRCQTHARLIRTSSACNRLSNRPADIAGVLAPFPSEQMQAHDVSPLVNKPGMTAPVRWDGKRFTLPSCNAATTALTYSRPERYIPRLVLMQRRCG